METFFRVISTMGPPGLIGSWGPVTETISIGSLPGGRVAVGEGVEEGVGLGDGPQPEIDKIKRAPARRIKTAVLFTRWIP